MGSRNPRRRSTLRQPLRQGSAKLVLSILVLNGYALAQGALPSSNLDSTDSLSSSPSSRLAPRQSTPSSRPSISMTPSLPSTSSLPEFLSSSFDSIVSSLSSTASSLSSRTVRASQLSIEGLPGTAITSTSDFEAIQSYLDCANGDGAWVYDPLGSSLSSTGKGLPVHKMDSKFSSCDKKFYKGRSHESDEDTEWNVRESLKYRFVPSSTCHLLLPSHLRPTNELNSVLPSRTRFCQLLAHKSLLLLGSTTQYSLHDLLLDYTTTEPQSCYGDLYCKEHALCGGILGNKDPSSVENFEVDERVYHRLPLPPSHSHLSPRSQSSSSGTPPPLEPRSDSSLYPSPTYSTLLRYRRTDSLSPLTLPHTLPSYQNPFTLLSEKNQQWLPDARRSDIIILEKPPLSIPLRGLKGGNETFDKWFYEYLESEEVNEEEKAERLFEAVKDVTERVWIPELMDALRSIRSKPSPGDQLVVYRSGWRSQSDCAAAVVKNEGEGEWDSPGDGKFGPLEEQPDLGRLLYRSPWSSTRSQGRGGGGTRFLPFHIIYHNLQIVLQNHLARTQILPSFGVIYLDLETPLSVWRSGLLGGSGGGSKGMRSSTSGDCQRYCFPSPGLSIESGFVGGLERLFELGWAGGDREKERVWVGEDFRNLRMRLVDREQA
ncbi:hypothetical protein JCM16303_006780 [Sporobolomyces ruberrimus]